ncbi:hypothetical protein QQZ08_006952 [Neonectria magnoliae]|uniref:Uncharacterized protein n=1 Tax=Neonectria magnoliae TaxID=2732573 RepID=A0ABR1I0X8_9HYPO
MVISILLDARDHRMIIHLSLTCAYFFRLLAPLIRDALVEDSGSWAGDRFIFVGDYAAGYPSGIATSKKKIEWAKPRQNPLYDLPKAVTAEGEKSKVPSLLARKDSFERWGELLEDARKGLDGEEESLQRMVKLLTQAPKASTPARLGPVLRNLTTKEYVRDAAIA